MASPFLQTVVCGGVKKHDKTLLCDSIILFEALFDLVVKGRHVSAQPSAGVFLTDGLSFGMKGVLKLKVQAWILFPPNSKKF